MAAGGRTRPRSAHLLITPGAIVLLFGAIVVAILARNLFVAARRPIGWAVAALVMAAAIEPLVSRLSRQMRRGLALLCVLLPLIVGVGFVASAVYHDLDHSIVRLQRALPQAATKLEHSQRFGSAARQLDLHERAVETAKRLKKPSANVAGKAAGSGSAWLVCTILMIFALAWGPRFGTGALQQIRDEDRRERAARVFGGAFQRSQRYLDFALAQGVVVGVLAWGLFRGLGVPAPTPLALLVGVLSMVPVVGILVGTLPAMMLLAGFTTFTRAGVLLAIAIAAQVLHVVVFRTITRRTLYVGPAVMVIAFLIGSDVYGLGGAVFGTAIAVFGIALADEWAKETRVDDLPPEDADPTEAESRIAAEDAAAEAAETAAG